MAGYHNQGDAKVYWIAHNNTKDIQSGAIEPGARVDTGYAFLEICNTEREFNQRMNSLEMDYPAAVAVWREQERLKDPVALLADERWKKETGGITLPSGAAIQTDREAQSQISATIAAIDLGIVAAPVAWKAKTGWLELTRDELVAVAAAVADHVNKCFRTEAAVLAQLGADPTLDVKTAFEAAYGAL